MTAAVGAIPAPARTARGKRRRAPPPLTTVARPVGLDWLDDQPPPDEHGRGATHMLREGPFFDDGTSSLCEARPTDASAPSLLARLPYLR
ncbi:hypothetical protein BH24ACT5_BH24ACT5_28530 [soil metagenome]